jgi:type I restriction enzyme M protein
VAKAVETAQEVSAYEPEEDETVTAAVIKKALISRCDGSKILVWPTLLVLGTP